MAKGKKPTKGYDGMSRHFNSEPSGHAQLAWEEARISEMLHALPPEPRILVVSCGDARHMRAFHRSGAHARCVLRDEADIPEARAMSRGHDIVSLAELSGADNDGAFDGIWICCAKGASNDRGVGYGELARMLAPEGLLVILALHGSCACDEKCCREADKDNLVSSFADVGLALDHSEPTTKDVCDQGCECMFFRKK